MNAQKLALGAMALLLIGGAAGLAWERAAARFPQVLADSPMDALLLPGKRPPELLAVDEQNAPVQLASLRGRWALLNFWFTDCAPCRDEMPSLHRLARKLDGKMSVIALSVDPSWEKVRTFHAKELTLGDPKPAYTLWLDERKVTPTRFGSFKFPETFLVDPEGKLRARFVGPRDWSSPEALALFEALTRA
jgi:cytochrome c biogenesis protein CcmG, thiol:disulfide interchange protein DsbE